MRFATTALAGSLRTATKAHIRNTQVEYSVVPLFGFVVANRVIKRRVRLLRKRKPRAAAAVMVFCLLLLLVSV